MKLKSSVADQVVLDTIKYDMDEGADGASSLLSHLRYVRTVPEHDP